MLGDFEYERRPAFALDSERVLKPSDNTDIARAEATLARSLARLQARAGHEF